MVSFDQWKSSYMMKSLAMPRHQRKIVRAYLFLSCELVGNRSRVLGVIGLMAVLLSLVEAISLLVVLVRHF